jgi:hypothetical protein
VQQAARHLLHLKMEVIPLPKRPFTYEIHGAISKKMVTIKNIFVSSPQHIQWLRGPPSLLFNEYQWLSPLPPGGLKLQGREAEHSPPSSAEAKNGGSVPPLLPTVFMSWNLIDYSTITTRPPLWSSGQNSWLQIRRPGFDSRHYQKKK